MMHMRDTARFIEVVIESKAPQNFTVKVMEYMHKCAFAIQRTEI